MISLAQPIYIFFYYPCVVHNNLIVKYQLCLNKLFSVSVSVSVCSLSITFVYTLSNSVLVVSHILVGNVIFGAKLEDNTFS